MRRRALGAALGALAAATAAMPAPAQAFYGNGAAIVSASFERLEQGDDASSFGAISADARWVAFQSRARNFYPDGDPDPPGRFRVGGIFRRDLVSGRVELVADGDIRQRSDQSVVARGAQSPSISADGRFVAFSTAQQLAPADVNDNVDVYVRDMAAPLRAAGAYELVSALHGTDLPPRYDPAEPPNPGGRQGSELFAGTSISADGRRVVFRTTAASDLPARPLPDAGAGQLLVRDRASKTTTLLTRDRDTGEPAGGAGGPAAISADGSTVAWTGRNAPRQTRFLSGESADPSAFFYLWRRFADGPGAPTRRITGQVDLDDPGCPADATFAPSSVATGPCYGPLNDREGSRAPISGKLPSLSGDGWLVAFVTGAGPRPLESTGSPLDLWLTDMHPGRSRKAASLELTRDTITGEASTSSDVEGAAISADGGRIALVSARNNFILAPPSPLGSFRRLADTRDVHLIDLRASTVERVTRGYDGNDVNGDTASNLTISADGNRVVFASAARNLFFGDANERADVFAATSTTAAGAGQGTEPPFEEPLAPPIELPREAPALSVRARSLPRGVVELTVGAPATGSVSAQAQQAGGGRKGKLVPAARRKKRRAAKVVARDRGRAAQAGPVKLLLRAGGSFRRLVRRRRQVAALAEVSFRPEAQGGQALKRRLRVTFAWKPKVKSKRRGKR